MNLVQIVISNIVSLYLLMILLFEVQFQALMGKKAGNAVKRVIYTTALASLMDMILSLIDGRPGMLIHYLNYYGNIVLFVAPVFIAWFWLSFIYLFYDSMNEKGEKPPFGYRLAVLPGMMILLMCAAQIFTPVLYKVDEANVYHRLPLSWIPVIVMLYNITVGFFYFYFRKDNRRLRSGNVFLFFAPIILGTFFQFSFTGVSTIFSSITIGLTGFYMSCHNELLMRDWLTGLLNRTCFISSRTRKYFKEHAYNGLIIFDIDDFKAINDQYGHLEGDACLRTLAGILQEESDQKDLIFRIAGDEFLIMSFSDDPDHLVQVGQKIRESLNRLNADKSLPYPLMVSFGTAWDRSKDVPLDDLVQRADAALYAMKAKKPTIS